MDSPTPELKAAVTGGGQEADSPPLASLTAVVTHDHSVDSQGKYNQLPVDKLYHAGDQVRYWPLDAVLRIKSKHTIG